MVEYRITMYNPDNRIDGKYVKDEWTSFNDVGKIFNGIELSREIYLEKEKAYIDCCIDLIEKGQISNLSIEQIEYYTENICLPSRVSDTADIRQVITACLREQCWLKLTSIDFFIHFGYDYYMYVGTALPSETVEAVAARYGLYCEQCPSPYNVCE